MRIIHEPFRGKRRTDPLLSSALDELLKATEKNRELSSCVGQSSLIKELNPVDVLHLFKNIQKCDIPLLGMTAEDSNPTNLIVTRVYVPPACIRPSVVSEIKSGT
jgi:DNA-directed RNA polymerase III subunit RPC1